MSAFPSWLQWSYTILIGACVGSFLNVVIYRVPRKLSVAHPPSACPGCEKRIAPYDNIPVLSWLFLRGRCRRCKTSIALRYPLIEFGTALIAALCVWQFGFGAKGVAVFALLAAMLAVALIDWEHMIIPDGISLGYLVLGIAISPFVGPGFWASLIGAAVGGGLLLAVAVLWEKLRGVEAMGGGDIKLMGAVGAFLGAVPALLIIFVGAFLGAIVGGIMLRRDGQARIAFGTFLSAATFLVVFFGDSVVAWYLQSTGLAGR